MAKKSTIENYFSGVQLFEDDVYVADYTEKANREGKHLTLEKRKLLRSGVEIQGKPFDDIAYFCLHNPDHKGVFVVNFEHNKGFFPKGIRDCECMMRPKGVKKGWLLLAELKYCQAKNIINNVDSAYKQLRQTWGLLKATSLFKRAHCKVFFNVSLPEKGDSIPFSSFLVNQDEINGWCRTEHVHLFGVNDVLIVNDGILQAVMQNDN